MKPNQDALPVLHTGSESSTNNSDTDTALTMFAELLLEIAMEEQKRKKRLEIEPNGFILEGGFTCCICHHGYNDVWYDKHGMKCLECQNAIDKKIIPVSACKNDDGKVFLLRTIYNMILTFTLQQFKNSFVKENLFQETFHIKTVVEHIFKSSSKRKIFLSYNHWLK